MPISTITSRAARKDLEKIKLDHTDMVTGIANQSVKIAGNARQKAAQMQNDQVMKNELEKEKMTANTAAQKTALDFQTKQSELDIKRAALTAI